MVFQIQSSSSTEIIYPESDGKPMADNTKQFRWILVIQQNLDWMFADNPNVFVAGDLFWYPVEGKPRIVTAPDVMVVVGRPKGERGSYQQWLENNIAPQVVFEILSPSNSTVEMDKKLLFYERYGVEEYYIYNPETDELQAWIRHEEGLESLESLNDYISPRLGIRFDCSGEELKIYRPDGEKFFSYIEIHQMLEEERQQLAQVQAELEAEKMRSQRLAERLREMGINPDEL
ncbi:MAG: Uma2 family endonuclease [Planktothrix sp.]|uniref:Uma2 family endonuclease n=1 Tax=Planktothrix sp. TaxID=3088171 RepID=UPI0038D48E6D